MYAPTTTAVPRPTLWEKVLAKPPPGSNLVSLDRDRDLAGDAVPARRHLDGAGTNFSLFSEVADGRAVPVRRRRHRGAAVALDGGRRVLLARLPPTEVRPASATATACTARGTPTSGQRCNPAKLLLDPYAKAIEGEVDWDQACFSYDAVGERVRQPQRRRQRPARPQGRRAQPVLRLGRRPPRPTRRCTRRSSTRCTSRASRPPPDIPEQLRGTYAGLAHPAAIDYLTVARRHRGRAAAGPPVRARRPPGRAGPAQLLGLQLDRLLRPAQRATRRRARPGRAGHRVQGDGARAARGRHRGDPRRRLQPHRRGQPPRARSLSFKGIDNAAYYRLVADDRRHYYDTTGTGNSLNVRHPHVLQLIMDSLRYWVTEMHVDGFRFDLAADAGPAAPRGRSTVGVLRPDPAGPGRQPGQADRRAVGRRRGRLPGRQLPAAWSEWNGKYRDTVRDFWRGDAGDRRRARAPG